MRLISQQNISISRRSGLFAPVLSNEICLVVTWTEIRRARMETGKTVANSVVVTLNREDAQQNYRMHGHVLQLMNEMCKLSSQTPWKKCIHWKVMN